MRMKILIFLFIFVVLFGQFFENSYGQTTDLQKKPTPKFFVQIQLYDKDGHLVGYIQGRPAVYDMNRTIAWVAPKATHSNVVFEGQTYELMKFVDHLNGGSGINPLGYYYVWNTVNGHKITIFREWHDSILTNTGDVAKVYWEILIPSH